MIKQPIALAQWHKVMSTGDAQLLSKLLTDDVVFHSPVVHTPQKGKKITMAYLLAASSVLGGEGFSYVRQIIGKNDFVLEFTKEIDGILINGVDIVSFNENDQITDFKVMVRPLKAVNMIHQKMGEMLIKMKNSK
jgi:hypothetical protein